MSKFSQLDASESDGNPFTDLQTSLLKGFVGFPGLQRDASESDDYPLTDLQTSLLKGFVGAEIPLTREERIIQQFNSCLFLWARGLRPEVFNQYIIEIIDTKYVPLLATVSARRWEKLIKNYLLASNDDSGDNRLAYILSSVQEKTGTLNTLLIQYLTPLMLQSEHLPGIRQAIKNGSFNTNLDLYTRAAVCFATNDNRFIHLYSTKGIKLFYQTMYDWIEALPSAKFKGIVAASLKEYEHALWGFSRRTEVQGYFKYQSQAKVLALIFLNGKDGSILNERLLQKVIEAMKVDISKNVEKQQNPGNKLIIQYSPLEHNPFYLKELKTYAVDPSYKQEQVSLTACP